MRNIPAALLLVPALLLAPASLFSQGPGSISVGAGMGLGIRLGATAHVRLFVAEDRAVGCAVSAAFRMQGRSCGVYYFPGGAASHFGLELGQVANAPMRGGTAGEGAGTFRAVDQFFVAGSWGGAWQWRRVKELGFRAAAGPALIFLSRETTWAGHSPRPPPRAEREHRLTLIPLWVLDLSPELNPIRR